LDHIDFQFYLSQAFPRLGIPLTIIHFFCAVWRNMTDWLKTQGLYSIINHDQIIIFQSFDSCVWLISRNNLYMRSSHGLKGTGISDWILFITVLSGAVDCIDFEYSSFHL
jgi:hypothetical protein